MKTSELQLGEIMDPKVVIVDPKLAAAAAWSRMQRRGAHHLVVADKGNLRGIVSERDLGGPAGAAFRKARMVEDLMARQTWGAPSSMTLREAADLIHTKQIGHLPIVDSGRILGIVTATQIFDELGRDLRRVPFPASVPRASKMESGSAAVPAHIRVSGVDVSESQAARIRKRLGARLGKFAPPVERISVRLRDVNGPKGGVDHVCRIKAVLSNFPSVVFEAR